MSKREELEQELSAIRDQILSLEERKRAIFAESLKLGPEDKICSDSIAECLSMEPPAGRYIEYPITVNEITWRDGPPVHTKMAKGWVKVRPCEKRFEGKTYLGVNIGDIARCVRVSLDPSGILHLGYGSHNPLIWIQVLGECVTGDASWWGEIQNPEDLKEISDADIHDVWYVRMLRELFSEGTDMPAEETK